MLLPLGDPAAHTRSSLPLTSPHTEVVFRSVLSVLRSVTYGQTESQRECNFGGYAEGIEEQLQGISETLSIGRQRWRYRERRESLRSLCKAKTWV